METRDTIFISWSGERSRMVAEKLREWLPLLLDLPQLWLSSRDMPSGSRWNAQLASQLAMSNFGILVITPENRNSPWLVFEAGALSKNLEEGTVVPYLIDIMPTEIDGPLNQFQAHIADRQGTLRLVQAINGVVPNPTDEKVLAKRFDGFWPEMNKFLKSELPTIETEHLIKSNVTVSNITENHEIARLRGELEGISNMVKQLVRAWEPATASYINQVGAEEAVQLKNLEGAWFNSQSKTYVYVKRINGQLYAPYCYGGDEQLTGVYYDWKVAGEYLFGKFRWIGSEIKGFAFFKQVSDDLLEGSWWSDDVFDDETPNIQQLEGRTDGIQTKWQRLAKRKVPKWAQEYFSTLLNQ